MAFIVVILLAAAGAAFHLFFGRGNDVGRERIVEICLLYLLTVVWGFGAALLALPHILAPDYVAAYVDWPAGNPFQIELGFANLGRALLGILCIWFRGPFWIAPVVSNTVFGLGAGYVHVREIVEHANYSPGNAGPVLFVDIAIPLLAIVLLRHHLRGGPAGPGGR